eukprot:CAMPEP_0197023280 /NCGR_PEP_ID=MMETSP1384-20130603/4022_1 /TAXON_ID=29189 /ORGANISM="Ammonia sp." /LENGTH=513 /DNA_ID=CAMNT_0042451475 /DNA_START=65 /DNA_END=1606 /DNA_ORIENTATION=-
MSFHPIQLNFSAYINNPTLSDIKLKANLEQKSKPENVVSEQKSAMPDMDVDENKGDEADMSFISSLDDDDHTNASNVDQKLTNSIDGSIACHWDILRARCIVFDLLFHAIFAHKLDDLPISDLIRVDTASNTIHFDISYQALLIVIKYLYTGITKRYDYDDLNIARDVVYLANVLHLDQLRVDINGQFLSSRRHLKGSQDSNGFLNDDTLNEWRALKLETFDFADWDKQSQRYFLNINVLYHFDRAMYKSVNSRQRIKIDNELFQISKIIYVAVSEYFKAMFCGYGVPHGVWRESAHNLKANSAPNNHDDDDVIEMKEINSGDFERLQRFLYTFDQTNYYDTEHGSLNDLDFIAETASPQSERKKQLLNATLAALHLSIFFGIDDLRQCLLLIIDKYYVCNYTLYPFWNLAFEYELKDVKELCCNYFVEQFGSITNNEEIFYSLNKEMIKAGLAGGKVRVSTEYMIEVLLKWAQHHDTSIQELLPPNTLFNEANKSFVLCNRRAMNLQHLLRL